MIATLLNLLICLQRAYDVMEIYSKINRQSKGLEKVHYSNLENDAMTESDRQH